MIFKAAVGVEMGGMLKPLHFIFIILMIHFWRLLRPEGCSVFEGIVVGVLINWLPIIILYEFMAWLHNLQSTRLIIIENLISIILWVPDEFFSVVGLVLSVCCVL